MSQQWDFGSSKIHDKVDVPPVGNRRSCLIDAVTLHFEMVVSASKAADLERVGKLSCLGEFSILMKRFVFSYWQPPVLQESKNMGIQNMLNDWSSEVQQVLRGLWNMQATSLSSKITKEFVYFLKLQ